MVNSNKAWLEKKTYDEQDFTHYTLVYKHRFNASAMRAHKAEFDLIKDRYEKLLGFTLIADCSSAWVSQKIGVYRCYLSHQYSWRWPTDLNKERAESIVEQILEQTKHLLPCI
jgi:hypothetical protein